ncbi:MAG: hypothetical protein U0350_40775 [Caldilineaceae bacterium]
MAPLANPSITIVVAVVGLSPTTDWQLTGPNGDFSLLTTGGTQVFDNLTPDADYTFSQTSKAGYTTAVTCDNGTTGAESVTLHVVDGDNVTCTFTNTAQPATINVVNTVMGLPPSSDWLFTGPSGAFTTTATGGSQSFLELAAGSNYSFIETPKSGYTVAVVCDNGANGSDSVSITPLAGQTVNCTFTNTAQPGTIKIVNKVSGLLPGTPWLFTGTAGTFRLYGAIDSQKFLDLAAGNYTFAVTTKSGYTTAVACDNGTVGTNSVTVRLKPGKDVICTFLNTAQPSTLTIINSVNGVAPATNWEFNGPNAPFTLQANGGAQSFTVNAGNYVISEIAKLGYTVTASCNNGTTGADSVTLAIGLGQNVTCTFTNTAQPGQLTVVATVVGAAPATAWDFNGPAGAFTLAATGGSQSFSVNAGAYSLSATAKEGYTTAAICDNGASGGNSVLVNLNAGEQVTCTFTSSAQPGSLTVIQSVDGVAPDSAWQFSGPSGNFSLPATGGTTNIAATSGSNTLVETVKPGYATHVTCDNGASGGNSVVVNVQPGQKVACTFAATTQPANLTLVQNVTGMAPTGAWQFNGPNGPFTLAAAGGTQTFALPAGSYAIAETAKSGYTVAVACSNGVTGSTLAALSLKPGDNVTCTFTATAQPGTLTVVKLVDGVAPDTDWQFSGPKGAFTLPALGGTQNFTITADSYTVNETAKPGYVTHATCSNNVNGANSVTISLKPGENVTCTFTDTDRPATLTVKVVVVGAAATNAWAFAGPTGPFTVTASGGTRDISLPAGSYALAETLQNGYSIAALCSNGASGANQLNVTLKPGEHVNCVFTNTAVTVHPAIELKAVVSTVANNCTAGSTLTVIPNTPVYYCLVIKNVGDVALTQFILVNSQEGGNVEGQEGNQATLTLAVALAPGQEIKVTNEYLAALKVTTRISPIIASQDVTTNLLVVGTNVSMGATVTGSATTTVSVKATSSNSMIYLPLVRK